MALDRSLSMAPYWETTKAALVFLQAIPEDDHVAFITFGNTASNSLTLPPVITPTTPIALVDELQHLGSPRRMPWPDLDWAYPDLGEGLAVILGVIPHLLLEGSRDREAADGARRLLAFARHQRFNYFEAVQNTPQLVQVIPYATDPQTKGMEYFRYAIETFYDDVSDCDCKAILAAMLFRVMGLRSVVLISVTESHTAVALERAPDFPGSHYFQWRGGRLLLRDHRPLLRLHRWRGAPDGDPSTKEVRVEIKPELLSGESA